MESLIGQVTDAITATGNDLNNAYTALSNGDSSAALSAINQAIADITPLLSESANPPHDTKH